jgi:hypothetical protein
MTHNGLEVLCTDDERNKICVSKSALSSFTACCTTCAPRTPPKQNHGAQFKGVLSTLHRRITEEGIGNLRVPAWGMKGVRVLAATEAKDVVLATYAYAGRRGPDIPDA